MSKRIESPVKRYPGSVVLHDPLTYPQLIAFQNAITEAQAVGETTWVKLRQALLPGILACVESWNIEGVPEEPNMDNFPATPIVSAGNLVNWLQESITALLVEAETIPNE